MTCFSPEEINMILEVHIESLLNQLDIELATAGSQVNNLRRKVTLLDNYEKAYKQLTTDKIFLMNRVQANNVYSLFEDYILASPTQGAVAKSGYKTYAISEGKTWHYWLRDSLGSAEYPYYTMDITTDGRVSADLAYSAQYGVRPSFYLNPINMIFQEGDGSISTPYLVKRHEWGKEVILTEATCNMDGKSEIVCLGCGFKEAHNIERLGHNLQAESQSTLFIFNEIVIYTCANSGITYTIGGTLYTDGKILSVVAILLIVSIAMVVINIKRKQTKRSWYR